MIVERSIFQFVQWTRKSIDFWARVLKIELVQYLKLFSFNLMASVRWWWRTRWFSSSSPRVPLAGGSNKSIFHFGSAYKFRSTCGHYSDCNNSWAINRIESFPCFPMLITLSGTSGQQQQQQQYVVQVLNEPYLPASTSGPIRMTRSKGIPVHLTTVRLLILFVSGGI